jgi:hypothetical protein
MLQNHELKISMQIGHMCWCSVCSMQAADLGSLPLTSLASSTDQQPPNAAQLTVATHKSYLTTEIFANHMNSIFVAFRFTGSSNSVLLRASTSTSLARRQHNIPFACKTTRSFAYSNARYYSSSMASSKSESLHELCTRVQAIVPEQFRKDAWYLIVVCPPLYKHKTHPGPSYSIPILIIYRLQP